MSKWALKKEDGEEEDDCDEKASLVSHGRHFQKQNEKTSLC